KRRPTNVTAAIASSESSVRTARRRMSAYLDETEQAVFVDDLDAQLLGFDELGSGVLARDDITGLLAHRPADLAARGLDEAGGLVAAQVRQAAGENEGEALKRSALR